MKVNFMFIPAALALTLFVAAGASTIVEKDTKPKQDPPLKTLTKKCANKGGIVRFHQDRFESRATCGDGTVYIIKLKRKEK